MTDRIVIDPNVRVGKPCLAGTRIAVADVLELVRDGLTVPEIRQHCYPDLTAEDVAACVQYALDLVALQAVPPVRFAACQPA